MATLAMSDIAMASDMIEVSPSARDNDSAISEDIIARKFLRPANRLQDVMYEVTRDPGYLHQYYLLRGEMYVRSFGASHYCGKPDSYDDMSDVVVARIGNHVIGGCRMTYCHPASPRRLPMEKTLVLSELLPDLPLQDVIHAELSKMAILPEYQNTLAMMEVIRTMLKYGAEKKARYAFAISPLSFARNYRRAGALFGLDWQIRRDIEVPAEEYDGLHMVMSMIDLAPIYAQREKADITGNIHLVS